MPADLPVTRRSVLKSLAATAVAAKVCAAAAQTAGTVLVSADPTSVLGHVAPGWLGFSTEKNLIGNRSFYVPANTDFRAVCQRLGPQVLRVGGTHVDHVSWSPDGPGGVEGTTAPSDIRLFAQYIGELGWKVVYGLNLAHSSPEQAAQEAHVAADALGSSLLAFEIGNEPDLFVAHGDRPAGYSYSDFLAEWKQFAAAVRQAAPDAPLSGPGAFHVWQQFALPFAHDVDGELQLLTQHYYRMSGKRPGATVQALLNGVPDLLAEVQTLSSAAARAHIAGGFRMIETNTFVGGGLPGVSDRTVAALWLIDYALGGAARGMSGLNLQIGPPAHSNSPIAMGPGAHISSLRPGFYGLLLLSSLGHGDLLKTNVLQTPDQLSAFCISDVQGQMTFVLVNLADQPIASLAVKPAFSKASCVTLLLRGDSLLSQACQLAGETIQVADFGAPSWSAVELVSGVANVAVPAASALCLRFKKRD